MSPVIVTDPDTIARIVVDAVDRALTARGMVATAPATSEPVELFVRVKRAAEILGISERACWTLVRDGLPTVGEGRSRRVDIERAREWMRARVASPEQIDARAAQAAARARRRAK